MELESFVKNICAVRLEKPKKNFKESNRVLKYVLYAGLGEASLTNFKSTEASAASRKL